MSPAKRILSKTRELKEKVREFREEAKKPKESITSKTSMFGIVSWAFYDLGNTIFSILIVSFYFTLWIINDDVGGSDSDYAYANAISMALVFLTAPVLVHYPIKQIVECHSCFSQRFFVLVLRPF